MNSSIFHINIQEINGLSHDVLDKGAHDDTDDRYHGIADVMGDTQLG